MAEQSGFFNALKTESGYDRKYNANDYSSNMAAIIGNGVRRTSGNPLRVTAAGGMSISVQMGRAWIEGYWYFNDTTGTANFIAFSLVPKKGIIASMLSLHSFLRTSRGVSRSPKSTLWVSPITVFRVAVVIFDFSLSWFHDEDYILRRGFVWEFR